MITKKDLLEALENVPMDMPIMVYRGAFYVPIEFVHTKKLWKEGKQVECICIEPKLWEDKLC